MLLVPAPAEGRGVHAVTDLEIARRARARARRRPACLAVLVGAAAIGWAAAPAFASQPSPRLMVRIDGHDPAKSSSSHPIVLSPSRVIDLDVTLVNPTARPVAVSSVVIEGRVLGLTFFSYVVSLDTTVPPRTTERAQLPIDLTGLRGQATGLIRGSIEALGPGGGVVASEPIVTDVHGSLTSVYGVFGIAIALLTVAGFASAIVGLARRTLPLNRAMRAIRFGVPAVGFGLLVIFTLSAISVLAPSSASGIPIVVLCAVVGVALGFLTPTNAPAAAFDRSEGYGEVDDEAGYGEPPDRDPEPTITAEGATSTAPAAEYQSSTAPPTEDTSSTAPPVSPPPT